MIPSIIQLSHALEDHKHLTCISIEDAHIHEKDLDCSLLHRQFQTLSIDFSSNYDVIPQQYYAEAYTTTTDLVKLEITSRKNPRGPPFFIV